MNEQRSAILTNRPQLISAALILIILLVIAVAWFGSRDPDSGKLRVTVIDVGQGDSILIESPTHRTILIDGGGANEESDPDAHDVGLKVVVPYLRYRGINHLDMIILTHPHSDHVGGLAAVLSQEDVGQVLDGTNLPYPTPAYTAFLTAIKSKRIPYRHAVRGMHLDLGDGVTGDILNPPLSGMPYGTGNDNATMNNYSAVIRLTYGSIHFLLDGDAETEAEQSMLAASGDVAADVLKCGHHGAGNATSDAWLARVHPRFAAISCGRHNIFGHPNASTISRLNAHGVKVFRTDQDGAIVFVSDGKTVEARPTVAHN